MSHAQIDGRVGQGMSAPKVDSRALKSLSNGCPVTREDRDVGRPATIRLPASVARHLFDGIDRRRARGVSETIKIRLRLSKASSIQSCRGVA